MRNLALSYVARLKGILKQTEIMLFRMTWQLIKSSISTIRKFKQHRGIFETFTTALVVILPVLQWQTEKGKVITPLTTLHASRHGTKSYSTHNFGSTAVTQVFQASPFLLTDTHTDTKKKRYTQGLHHNKTMNLTYKTQLAHNTMNWGWSFRILGVPPNPSRSVILWSLAGITGYVKCQRYHTLAHFQTNSWQSVILQSYV